MRKNFNVKKNKLINMGHDITHCKGKDCPFRHICYRYLAYKEPYDGPISVLQSTHYKDGECEYFMDSYKI